MLPVNKEQFIKAKFLETARASYPGGMSMYGNGIVEAGTKMNVSDFFVSKKFNVPRLASYQKDHEKNCKELSKMITLNRNKSELNKITVAAKFIDTFLYQLMKFDEYRYLWSSLNLIIDSRILRRLKKTGDEQLIQFLKNYPNSPYEATYSEYLKIQDALSKYVKRLKSDFIKNRIELNFLWAVN